MELSKRDARKIFLHQQGLLRDQPFGRGKNAALRTIAHLSYLQIDTISVVNRAHDHILQTRVPNYRLDMLNKLMLDRSLYEYWSHAAAYMPFDNFRYSLPVMQGWKKSRKSDQKLAKNIIERIRVDGPLQSKDFEAPPGHKSGGWWEWKPAKMVLDHLFLTGELMVSHRQGFQKVFDLPENIVPSHVDTSVPDQDDWARFLVRSMIQPLGVATEYDLSYSKSTIRRLAKVAMGPHIKTAIASLCRDGELNEVSVAGKTYYALPSLLDELPIRANKKTVKFLSPFDNLIINRRRALELFDFDYQIECYLPADKRQYGYFALPMLYGDELIGRLDAKADRKTGQLELKNLCLDVKPDDKLLAALQHGLKQYAEQLGCTEFKFGRTNPSSLRQLLQL